LIVDFQRLRIRFDFVRRVTGDSKMGIQQIAQSVGDMFIAAKFETTIFATTT
jgi:hypothetical protein